MTDTPSQGRFSLPHLIAVLVSLSTIAVVAIPGFFAQDTVTLENGSVLLASDLRAAQNRAAFSREALFMRFFADGDGYEVVSRTGNPIDDPRTGRPFVRRYSFDGVFEGLAITALSAGQDRTLVLSTTGETSDALVVELSFLGDTRTIRAARSTGIVQIDGTTSGFLDDGL